MAEYIEREALLDEIRRIGGHGLSEWDTLGVRALVVRQPTADVVEVRHGKWVRAINQKHSAKWSSKVACSVCRCKGYERYNYCPNCGAKMDGKGENA